MQLAIQLMMGVSLSACAGLRAWLPLLVMGMLERGGYNVVSPGFSFLGRTDVLVMLGVATVIEVLGDKIPAVDHLLDAAATFVRPVAGAVLASSMLTGLDPAITLLLGITVGGSTALTVHAGKAAVRAGSTAASPLHAGAGNTALSVIEDCAVGAVMWLTLHAPVVAFVISAAVVVTAAWLAFHAMRAGVRVLRRVRRAAPGGVPPA